MTVLSDPPLLCIHGPLTWLFMSFLEDKKAGVHRPFVKTETASCDTEKPDEKPLPVNQCAVALNYRIVITNKGN